MRRLIAWTLALGASLVGSTLAGAQASESSIAAVVAQWQNPPSSTDSLQILVMASASLRDARVLAAAQTAVQSQGSSQEVRVAGLRVLLTFATGRPGSLMTVDEITDPDSLELVVAIPGIPGEAGAQPVTSATLASLVSAMQTVSVSDPNTGVRAAAGRVRRYAEFATAPKPQLSYVCRTKFRIRSTSNFVTDVEYAVAGTSETGRVVVASREPNVPYTDTFFATDNYGTVSISSTSGEPIASAGNNRTPCPT